MSNTNVLSPPTPTFSISQTATAAVWASLRCPYCGSPLDAPVGPSSGDAQGHFEFGVLRCECAEFPVLSGIPVLQHVDGLHRVVQLLKENDPEAALLQAMNVFRVKWAQQSRLHQLRYQRNCRSLIRSSELTFEDALQLVRKPTVFADYLLHRYANASFLADVSLMPVMSASLKAQAATRGGRRLRVLDIGCGAGHSSFLLSALFPHIAVVASDQDFVSLYLAKRFMAPGAEFVCTDVEVPSPFADDAFDAVHCLDAFHYFRSKRAIIGELRRIVRDDGFWMFPHLHNALQENVTAGVPLSPEHYARCFEPLAPTLFDESHLLQQRADVRRAEHHDVAAASRLRGAQTVAIVANTTRALDEAEPLIQVLHRASARLTINPIYEAAWRGETATLRLRWPNDRLREECHAIETIVPTTLELSRDDLTRVHAGNWLDDERLRELVLRFVLVPLPENYARSSAARPKAS